MDRLAMDTLNGTQWDVVISGTGLPQSLLALALSRSGKRIIHVDHNTYYGGADAALSLQDAEAWVHIVNEHNDTLDRNQNSQNDGKSRGALPVVFQKAAIFIPTEKANVSAPRAPVSELGYSRAYSLALSPQLIYTRSELLPTLVSSKVYRQLEFLAVGSWWLYESDKRDESRAVPSAKDNTGGKLKKIPGGREDVFADKTIDLKSKRNLMKFLKLAADVEAQQPVLAEWGHRSFEDFLTSQFSISLELQSALHALTLSLQPPTATKTSYALPRITRHLSSIGVFGPGFGSVIPKWGGMAEIAQVACRAGAVGGGIYVLGKAVIDIRNNHPVPNEVNQRRVTVGLQDGDTVTCEWIAGSDCELPGRPSIVTDNKSSSYISRSITIVSSSLLELFPLTAEGAPPPAGAIVVFPTGSIKQRTSPPVYFIIHSSDTGECPTGQCVIYASTLGSDAFDLLDIAIQKFFMTFAEEERPSTLWKLQYSQQQPHQEHESQPKIDINDGINSFPESGTDLAFDDSTLATVREAWNKISGDTEGYMQFEDREIGAYDDEGALT
ncbi:Rab proteins geranylgeranyltransferase component A [Xylographa opegraphella]|nr:Rab proteins geranylgeranyltransferase component A [Xylographa opegraphella]